MISREELTSELDGAIEKVVAGEWTAMKAAALAVRRRCLLIGTLEPTAEHTPGYPITNAGDSITNVALDSRPILRATRNIPQAILCAGFGDCNVQGQMYTQNSPLVEGLDPDDPNRPRYGWKYDHKTGVTVVNVPGLHHQRLANDPSRVLGAIDIIRLDGSFEELTQRHPDGQQFYEPGNFFSHQSHSTLASIPTRAADILQLPLTLTEPMGQYEYVPIGEWTPGYSKQALPS